MKERLRELLEAWFKECDVAEWLESCGVIVPEYSVRIGQKIFYPYYDEDGKKWYIDDDTVTDVCTKGIYVSDITGADNNGCLILWDEIDDTVFLSYDKAKQSLKFQEEQRRKGCKE